MVPNLPRKLFGIVLVSILAIWSMAAFNIHLGLDLSGGSRIVYKIDFEEALEKQQIGVNTLGNEFQSWFGAMHKIIGFFR